ncbi:hypothetical protein [Deinococcus cavernae]|nr:hypothetical protein [Deinococcus cavernae]
MNHDETYDDLDDDVDNGPTITLHLAPLIPCDTQGNVENPQPHCFRIGPFGAGAPSLAACLSEEDEFVLHDRMLDADWNSPEGPAWALQAWSEIDQIFGLCHDFVLYRRRGQQEVKVSALLEVFEAGTPDFYIPAPAFLGHYPSGELPELSFSF